MEEKPYSLQALVAELKSKGLDIAEDAAKIACESVLAWLEKSGAASANKVDDVLVMIIPVVKPYIMVQIDKIDGKNELSPPAPEEVPPVPPAA